MNKFPFKLKRSDAYRIIDAACYTWKRRISTQWSDILFEDHVVVEEYFYKDMRRACTIDQNEIIDEIFGKDIYFNILNDEDVFYIKSSYPYLFKGKDPFETKVNGLDLLDKKKFENRVCHKDNVEELRKATEAEKELYYVFYPDLTKENITWSSLGEISGYFVNTDSDILEINSKDISHVDKNVFPTKKDAESALALAQLLQLRDVYNGKKFDEWKNENNHRFSLLPFISEVRAYESPNTYSFLCFEKREIAEKFIKEQKELLNTYFQIT